MAKARIALERYHVVIIRDKSTSVWPLENRAGLERIREGLDDEDEIAITPIYYRPEPLLRHFGRFQISRCGRVAVVKHDARAYSIFVLKSDRGFDWHEVDWAGSKREARELVKDRLVILEAKDRDEEPIKVGAKR